MGDNTTGTDWSEAVCVAGIILLIVLFAGDPDLHDVIIEYLRSRAR